VTTFQQSHELRDPLVVAVRVKHAPGEQDRFDALEVLEARYLSTFGLDDEAHVDVDVERRVVVVGGLAEEIVEDVTKGATAVLRLGMRLVRLKD